MSSASAAVAAVAAALDRQLLSTDPVVAAALVVHTCISGLKLLTLRHQ
jgi:hypothetical protein